jgi:hypothetical protein
MYVTAGKLQNKSLHALQYIKTAQADAEKVLFHAKRKK